MTETVNDHQPLRDRALRAFTSVRTRFVVGYLVLVAAAIAVTMFVAHQVLTARSDNELTANLEQEVEELRSLASGVDPETGDPFGSDVRRLFEVFLSRQIPAENEAMLTIVDGRPFLRTPQPNPYRVDQDPLLVRRWANVDAPARIRGDTPAGVFDSLAVPIELDGEILGVFVVGFFRDAVLDDVRESIRLSAQVGAAVLLLAAGLSWSVATRVLSPVREMTRTARRISESDLASRLPAAGHDELAELGRTFNGMLTRLETAFETQRQFIDDASHELRTPITAIRGHLELLPEDPAERRATLDLVLDELDRMHRIVDDLLLLARAQHVDILRPDLVEVADVTRQIFEKASALAPREWQLGTVARGTVIADRQRVTQAVLQLAQNAVQHTEEGALIEIGSRFVRSEAHLWVRDTGAGIAPEEQERIFDRFRRGLDRRSSPGAGLGLAIVRTIALAHGGRVEVESEVGTGSTFTLVVPIDPPAEWEETT